MDVRVLFIQVGHKNILEAPRPKLLLEKIPRGGIHFVGVGGIVRDFGVQNDMGGVARFALRAGLLALEVLTPIFI